MDWSANRRAGSIAGVAMLVFCIVFTSVLVASPTVAHAKSKKKSDLVVAIDAGHQSQVVLGKERIDPDNASLGKKYKEPGGCVSAYNKMPEYKYTLIMAKRLRAALKKEGYKVAMIRTKNSQKVSNIQRAKKANKSGAVICIRLHCDSYGSSAHGVSVLYKPGSNSYYSKTDAKRSKFLASMLLKGECSETRFANLGLSARNDLTGCNWSKIPVALVEMGFFSNYSEAKKMSKKKYQRKIVKGLVKGVNKYMKRYYL